MSVRRGNISAFARAQFRRLLKRRWRPRVRFFIEVLAEAAAALLTFLAVSHVITPRRHPQAERVLCHREQLAGRMEMAALLAHQINNPLSAITNSLFLMRGSPGLDNRARDCLDWADDSLKRITHIVRQTLSLFCGRGPLEQVKVSDLLADVVRSETRADSVLVDLRLDSEYEVAAAREEIRLALENLVKNAVESVRAREGAGRLRVHVRASRELREVATPGTRIFVADNGTGVVAEQRNRIFEPFVSTKEQQGAGLGLWTASAVAEKYGGFLRLHSSTRPGRSGSCFCLFLPSEQVGTSTPRPQTFRHAA